jgi:hypothetical protein
MDALAARDIGLSLRLVVDAPHGSLTDELRRELAARKPALIRRLVPPVQEPTPDPETLTQAAEPAPLDPSMTPITPSWREPIAWWPIEWRQRWADRAEALQAGGLPRDRAEWLAFLEEVAAINAAEAGGKRIDFQPPAESDDAGALDQILAWPADVPFPSWAELVESGRAWNEHIKSIPHRDVKQPNRRGFGARPQNDSEEEERNDDVNGASEPDP